MHRSMTSSGSSLGNLSKSLSEKARLLTTKARRHQENLSAALCLGVLVVSFKTVSERPKTKDCGQTFVLRRLSFIVQVIRFCYGALWLDQHRHAISNNPREGGTGHPKRWGGAQ